MIILKGGTVFGADQTLADVAVDGGRVVEIGTVAAGPDDRVIDCSGAWVGPGLVDVHVHLREPGQEWKEDIASGSRSAAAGGFTTVVAMPNTEPAVDSGQMARYVHDRGVEAGVVRVVPSGTISLERAGRKLSHIDDLWAAGVRIFTDDGDSVADAGLLRRAMEYIAELGGIVAQHAEDSGLAGRGHMHEGAISSRLGMIGLPSMAETIIVERDIRLVELTGCRYHVQHVSARATIEVIRRAKAAGLPVTAEVAPHHLAFTDRLVESMNPVAKMYPPLRSDEDVAALRVGLADGTIDCVATDHAPHSAHEKDVPFEEAPRGVIGLETAAAAINTSCALPIADFFDRMAVRPGQLLGLETGPLVVGSPGDVTVFDPAANWTPETFVSKSANSPWIGHELTGRVRSTIYGGQVSFQLGEDGQ
ncbi:MAG: dihydroorotase [Acidimicrobiia bacterium]|nr:dihydroorotase [Acidimicrobiia bacterium]MDH5503907.1 dihydroorotase [Acidimicrobiia bacterium]